MSRTYKEFGDLLSAYNEADEKWMPIQKAHELLGSVNEDEIWEQWNAASNALFKYIAELTTRIAELEAMVEQLIWVGNDLLIDNANPVTVVLFNGLVAKAKEKEREK